MNIKKIVLLIVSGIPSSLMGVQSEKRPGRRCAPVLRPVVGNYRNGQSTNQTLTPADQEPCTQTCSSLPRHSRSMSDPVASSSLSRHRRTSSSGSFDTEQEKLDQIIKNLRSALLNDASLGVKLIEINFASLEITEAIKRTSALRASNEKFANSFLRRSIYLLELIAKILELKQPAILEENENNFTLNELVDTLNAVIANLQRALSALRENTNDAYTFRQLEELEVSIHKQIDTLIHRINQQGLPLKRSVRFAE